jgi:hypothetical protein
MIGRLHSLVKYGLCLFIFRHSCVDKNHFIFSSFGNESMNCFFFVLDFL